MIVALARSWLHLAVVADGAPYASLGVNMPCAVSAQDVEGAQAGVLGSAHQERVVMSCLSTWAAGARIARPHCWLNGTGG